MIRFKSNGDTVSKQVIHQWQNGTRIEVEMWDPETDELKQLWPIVWKHGVVPKDGVRIKKEDSVTSIYAYAICCTNAAVGIVLSIGFLTFNIMKRHTRSIRMTSPNINNIILFGCVVAYCSVFLETTNPAAVTNGILLCKVRRVR